MANIEVKRNGHILEIVVNRVDKFNALNVDMYQQIAEAYGLLDRDPELRVGLFHAKGKHFSSGLELTDWTETFTKGEMPALSEGSIDPFSLRGKKLSKPVVMALKGYCYTWVVEMMLNTDIRVCADDARFAQLEVKRGLFACGGATIRLQKEIGWANAQRYLLTGDEWSAADAFRLGLVQELCSPPDVYATAFEVVTKIAKAAPLAVKGSLNSSRVAMDVGEQEAIKELFPSLMPVMKSKDMQEGVRSFIEKREAIFQGC